jgi:hypothetical protein
MFYVFMSLCIYLPLFCSLSGACMCCLSVDNCK